MVRKQQPKDYDEVQAEKAPANSPLRTLLGNIAGPVIVAAILAGMGGIVSGWRNDLLFTERLGVIAGRVAALESEASKGERYTADDAVEIQRKYEILQAGLTDLRILVARMRIKENR